MALLCVANLASSSTTLASKTISVICLNCTLGSACPVWCVDVDCIEVINNPSGNITTYYSSASPEAPTLALLGLVTSRS
eukprot:5563679-Prorocentrum_lima.AAC.1